MLPIFFLNLYPNIHKLNNLASYNRLNILKGRPIITAHSWITSNPSKLLGLELDFIINQFKDFFQGKKTNFPNI